MTPIKMKDGNWAYPIKSTADLDAARKLKCELEFTACGCEYSLPSSRHEEGSGGWILTDIADIHVEHGIDDRWAHRVRGVLGASKPTLWQRIKGRFA